MSCVKLVLQENIQLNLEKSKVQNIFKYSGTAEWLFLGEAYCFFSFENAIFLKKNSWVNLWNLVGEAHASVLHRFPSLSKLPRYICLTFGLTSYARNSQKKQCFIFGEMRNIFQFSLSISCLVTIGLTSYARNL